MVAVIGTGNSIHRTFNYNENKCREKVAQCIGAYNYPKDLDELSISQKINMLLKQAALNPRVTNNSVHISLSFPPHEKFDDDKLNEIAERFMGKIGFGDQPFLVYRHDDTANRHIHIVSVKVRADGSRIDMNNIGKNQGTTARREIEQEFNLTRAEDHPQLEKYSPKPIDLSWIQGQQNITGADEKTSPVELTKPIKEKITKVLGHVLSTYSFTSISEMNAVLGIYNIKAHIGEPGSRLRAHRGVQFVVTDQLGRHCTKGIAASSFFLKPTLANLKQKFFANISKRQKSQQKLANTIKLELIGRPEGLADFTSRLAKKGIHTVVYRTAEGMPFGITYVDFKTRSVFTGSALGGDFKIRQVLESCGEKIPAPTIPPPPAQLTLPEVPLPLPRQPRALFGMIEEVFSVTSNPFSEGSFEALELLFQTEYQDPRLPVELTGKKRRKKRRRK